VTSATGAAFQDVRTVAFRRGGARLLLVPALVQGDGAPESLVRALALAAQHPEVDVVIVGRGGGSFEDLQAFTTSGWSAPSPAPVPVVSAVGHEIEPPGRLAADVRAGDPVAGRGARGARRGGSGGPDREADPGARACGAGPPCSRDGAVVARLRVP
jgi:exodeoxyribonuclease VII large subunit